MKRITLEKAEVSPSKIKMRNHLNRSDEVIGPDWDLNHNYISETWILRFIKSNLGKNYNKVYSKFLSKLNKSRIYKSGYYRDCALNNFRRYFEPSRCGRFYKDPLLSEYIIDDNGCIQKGYTYKRTRKKEIVLREFYKIKPELNHIIVSIFGIKGLQILQNGVNEEVLKNLDKNKEIKQFLYWHRNYACYWGPKCKGMFDKYEETVSKNNTSREFYKQCVAELSDKKNKSRRESKKEKQEYWDNVVFHNEYKEGGTAAKRRRIEEQKRIEAMENITRDRLGFDETSFKTQQKFKV